MLDTLTHALPIALHGRSAEVIRARAAVERPATATLILAEDGLEPEAVARYVHAARRGGQPFVVVDGSQPADVERRLLGARGTRAGALEVLSSAAAMATARAGTVYISHLAELPAAVQRRLARILRDGEASIGGRGRAHGIPHVVASAGVDLDTAVRDGRLRPDLFRRFGDEHVLLPPLRTRPADFPEVLAAAAAEVCRALGRAPAAFTQPAITVLAALPWQANVQELRRTLERILRGAADGPVRQEDVLAALASGGVGARIRPYVSLREARRRFEQDYIAAVLEQHQWRMSDAARTLGIERTNLYRKARQLGITRRFPGKIADAS